MIYVDESIFASVLTMLSPPNKLTNENNGRGTVLN